MIIPTLRVAEREVYEEMLPAWKQHGVKCMRVNMTRYGMERYVEDVRYIREQMGEDFGVMADLPIPGSKYRLLFEGIMEVEKGERLVFIPEKAEERADAIRVEIPEFSENAEKTRIIIGDGELSLQPEEITRFQITAIAENDAVIRGRKSFALLGVFPYALYEEEVLEEYLKALEQISPCQVVLSFSEDLQILSVLKEKIEERIPGVRVVPKLETQKGIDACEDMFQIFPEVMLGRGDLGLYSELTEFGRNQEKVLGLARRYSKNAIVATDILTSLYEKKIPSRGELTDLYYLEKEGVRDVVVSAGIAVQPEIFSRFCELAGAFQE